MDENAIIVGDVGGTNVRLALAHKNSKGHISLSHIGKRPVEKFRSLELALEDWLQDVDHKPHKGVFALAGPTGADEVRFTNSDWVVNAPKVKAAFDFESIMLVNDFAAQAMAIPATPSSELVVINQGIAKENAPIVVLGPGTGLGMAGLLKVQNHWQVLPTEGGHQAFAPRSDIEREILSVLSRAFEVVSFEHVLSGPGLLRIYKCLGAIKGELTPLDTPPEIGEAAANFSQPLAVEAAKTLSLILATFCANAILGMGAQGGCVIAGGVAEQLSQFIMTNDFIERFRNIGPMANYVRDVPVYRNNDAYAALKGAAMFAQ
jgi:glucokinase